MKSILFSLLGLALLLPSLASAAPSAEPGAVRPFIYGSPAGLYIPAGDDSFSAAVDPGYQWSFGAGIHLALEGKGLRPHLGLGFRFEHLPMNYENSGGSFCLGDLLCTGADIRGELLRADIDVRLGLDLGLLWVYGIVRPGADLYHYTVTVTVLGQESSESETEGGLHLGIGAGALVAIGPVLRIGAELTGDLGFFEDDNALHTVGISALIGASF